MKGDHGELFARVRGPFRVFSSGEETQAHTRGVMAADESDHRYSVSERFAGRGRAAIGIGVERDVDVAVGVEVLGLSRLGWDELDAVHGHAVLMKSRMS